MADRFSPAKAIGWSIAFVVLVFLLTGLIAFGLALPVTGSASAVKDWLEGSGPGPAVRFAVAQVLEREPQHPHPDEPGEQRGAQQHGD